MIKKLLVTLLVASILGTPNAYARVSESEHATKLEAELAALKEYITRLSEALMDTPLTDSELRSSIMLGTQWLMRAQEPSGHFRYEYHPFENSYAPDDNIVRQTGALYVLSEVLTHDPENTLGTRATVERAISYFESISKKGEYNGTTFRCVAKSATSRSCDLGATALALVGILNYREYAPKKREQHDDLARDYHAFILAMQKEEGGFRNRFVFGKSYQSPEESPYSNGEALLALTRYHLHEHGTRVPTSITRALSYLMTLPYDNALYLWIMAALKDIERIDTSLIDTAYVRGFTEARIREGAHSLRVTRNFCAYTEGVVSALSVLHGRVANEVFTQMAHEAERGLRMNRALQLSPSATTRAFAHGGSLELLTMHMPERAGGGFLTGEAPSERTERVDYTQHCVSAYLQMLTDIREQVLIP